MADRKGFNGLRMPPGGVPQIGDRAAQVQRAIAQEMQALMHEIYVRSASRLLAEQHPEGPAMREMEELARTSQTAARAFFTGLGVIEIPPETEPPAAE